VAVERRPARDLSKPLAAAADATGARRRRRGARGVVGQAAARRRRSSLDAQQIGTHPARRGVGDAADARRGEENARRRGRARCGPIRRGHACFSPICWRGMDAALPARVADLAAATGAGREVSGTRSRSRSLRFVEQLPALAPMRGEGRGRARPAPPTPRSPHRADRRRSRRPRPAASARHGLRRHLGPEVEAHRHRPSRRRRFGVRRRGRSLARSISVVSVFRGEPPRSAE